MSPAQEYTERLTAREVRVAHHHQRHLALGNLRLLIAAITAILAWLSFGHHLLSAWWLSIPLLSFVIVAIYHSKVLEAKSFAERAVMVYQLGLARIEDRWAGTGQTGERFIDLHHVYAADLDLFGRASLFELLSTARTRMGEETLAAWLLSPSSLADILQRQAAVAELRSRLDLREDIAVLGEDARAGVHPDELMNWSEAPNIMNKRWLRLLAPLLAAAAIAGAVAWYVWGTLTPLAAVILIEGAITYALRWQLAQVLHGAEHAFADIELLSNLLKRIEKESFESPQLINLRQEISSHHVQPSQAISRLRTIVDLIASRENAIMRVLDLPLLYSLQVAYFAEAWRRTHGAAVRRWIRAVGEFEALLSLAAYSYEHPDDPFPQFVDSPETFIAEELGHPLIAAAACVRNTIHLDDRTRVLLVSGCNMSGKSTLLRAIGINVVLAMAGAPVRAQALRLSPLQIGASIRVNDSLQEGSSRFYAEITRLRDIVELAGRNRTLLFLLDELLQGTNSRDRRIGAEALIRGLLARAAIGLISTHDLALADIGSPAASSIRNVHFQDEFDNGKMRFDYKLRDGIVTKSNGLELMRSIGLDV